MTVARSQLVGVSVTPRYHVISRTMRGASLLCDGELDRKQGIEERLDLLVSVFAVEIGGFGSLDNHLHLLVNLLTGQIDSWSDEQVLARWYRIHPPRLNRQPVEITPELHAANATDHQHVAQVRKRLGELGWFMKRIYDETRRSRIRAP